MGFISQLAQGKAGLTPISRRGQETWRQIFGTSKEDGGKEPRRNQPKQSVAPGGSYGRSSISGGVAYKHLLEAMRSKAPGGWTDDRYEQSRHFVGMAYVAIHRKCTQLQQAEFQVFRKDKHSQDGKVPVEEEDPPEGDRLCKPYDLVKLLEKPNNQDSFGKWMYRLGQQKSLTGQGLTWIVPNQLGNPVELYCVPTALAIPQPAVNPDYPNGYYRIQPLYPYGPFSNYPTPTTSVGAAIPAEWMMRMLYPHPLLRYEGYSPMTAMRLHLDELESMDRSRWYSMKRTFRPNAALNFKEMEGAQPLPESEIERIHAEWENEWQGPENVGRIIVGTPGADLELLGTSPIDMDYQQGWDQLCSFILGGFGITKPAAGMVEDSSYSTLFATLKQLNLITLDPEVDDVAADITRYIAPYFGDDLIVEIRCKRIDDHDVNFSKVDKLTNLKGMPKKVIEVALKLLDIPIEDGMVEELSKAGEQEGGAPGGMPGMPGAEQPAEGGPEELGQEALAPADEVEANPEEVEEERPNPGNLSQGALGPRKSLAKRIKMLRQTQFKSLRPKLIEEPEVILPSMYDLVRGAISNGNGKH